MPAVFSRPRFLLWLIVPLVMVLWMLWCQQQGVVMPAYRLEATTLVQRVVASGEVSSSALARIGSEITGVVKARHVREGDSVKPGDVLIELVDDSQRAAVNELEAQLAQLGNSTRPQAAAALQQAESTLAQNERELERRERLREQQLIAAEALDQARNNVVTARAARDRARLQLAALAKGGSEQQQLEAKLASARATLAKTRIRAAFAGVVQAREVEPGDLVQPGATLLTIAPLQSREIRVPVDEKTMAPLALGQSARVIADAYPDQPVAAQVSFLAPAVDAETGTLQVHLALSEPADFLRLGMSVSATIESARREKVLVVPQDALFDVRGHQATVYRVIDGRAEAVTVTLGLRSLVASEVRAGLSAGDIVLAQVAAVGQRIEPTFKPLPRQDGEG